MAKFDPTQFEIVNTGDGRRMVSLLGGGGASLPWYNVKAPAYGALGDDATDDYAAFIAARDAIWAAGDPAVLYVPSGKYRLSNFIQLQSQAHRPPIFVLGDYARMRPTTDTSVFYRKWDDSADFSTIEQLLIDGFWFDPVTPGNSTGIHTVDSFATMIKNCRFTNLKIGVHVQSVNSWNEGLSAEDILMQGCTTGYDFNAPGGTGSFQISRISRNYIGVSAGHTGIKMHNSANMYGSRFDVQIWPQGNNAIGIDIDANIHSCEFRGIIDTAGGSGTPLYAIRFGASASNTDKAEFAMDFAGTYNGGEEQSGAVKNASSKTWYFDNFLPYGSSQYPRYTLLSATGDTPYASAANTWARRAIGSSGDISKVSGGLPTWAAPAALTKVDDTNVTATLGGSASTALVNAASLTLGWTGQLAVSRGGIGVGTLASNGVLYGNGTGAVQALAVNATATNKYLQQVSSGAPAWATIPASEITSGAALTKVDDTNVTLALGGTPASALLAAASLTLGWTGQLGLARGGTHVDLSATGGAGKYLKQASAGADITVASITAAEITSGAALTKTDDTNVTATLGGSPTTALLAAASLTLGWTGTLSQARGGTGSATPFANPSASVGLAAVNGSATTFMRSDAAPALSQAITPTWTGLHIWTITETSVGASSPNGLLENYKVEPGSALTGTTTGLSIQAFHDAGAFAVTTLRSVTALAREAIAGGTITLGTALYGEIGINAAGTLTTGIGLELDRFRSSGTFTTAIGIRINAVSGAVTNDIAIQTLSGDHRLVGSVQIGQNTAPAVELSVFAGTTPRIHLQSTSSGSTATDGFQLALSTVDAYLWNFENGPLHIATNNLERITVAAAGGVTLLSYLGIGTLTSPSNTTAGDGTFLRGHFGTDAAFTSGIGFETNAIQSKFGGALTLTAATTGAVLINHTLTNNTGAGTALLMINGTLNGSGDFAGALALRPIFAPSASIGDAWAGSLAGFFNPPGGVTITRAIGFRAVMASSATGGAITNAIAIRADTAVLTGGVTPTNCIGIEIQAQSGGTNNYDMSFGTTDAGGGAGAYAHRIPVLVNGVKEYLRTYVS